MRRLSALAAVAALASSAACGSAAGTDDGGTTLTVYAAASTSGPFTELGRRFEATHDGVTVRFSFAGSTDLVAQLQHGAPADVFASADEPTMDRAVDEGLVDGRPVVFATNTLVVAVPADNPADISSLEELAADDVAVVVCAREVPCGAAAVRVEEAAGIDIEPVSEERSVTDVLNKVTTAEADAGLVYATDVVRAGDRVRGIALPANSSANSSATNVYPVAALADSEHPALADEFVDLLTGDVGQQVLAKAGFAPKTLRATAR